MLNRWLAAGIPASLVSDVHHLREKTVKIGIVARTAAIFCVDEIIVFPDMPKRNQIRETEFIANILCYIETPQYLRKRLFKIKPEFRYLGALPPLRTPHHPLLNKIKNLTDGEYREGITVAHSRSGTLVDVGVEKDALLQNRKLPANTRITVKLRKSKKMLVASLVKRREIPQYWGFKVNSSSLSLGRLAGEYGFDLTVATSKYGRPLWQASEMLTRRLRTSNKILVAFGAPSRGLYELAEKEKWDLEEAFDFVVNTIRNQGVETVRTEEAMLATLGILTHMTAKG